MNKERHEHQVVIFQPRLLHYRIALFEQLRARCEDEGIDLQLVCGRGLPHELSRNDEAELPWATMVKNRSFQVAGRTIVWQPFPSELRGCDLAIVMQESRIISNYVLQARRNLHGFKVGYWGHGKNFFNKSPGGLTDKWKKWLINRVDWWFAYTDMVVDIVADTGFPKDKITCLNNAIDTGGFVHDLKSITDDDLAVARNELGVDRGDPVGVFCGSLYPDKRLDFLIEAADRIRDQIDTFKLIIIGAGPSAEYVKSASASRPWIHFMGAKRGVGKALYFRMAEFMLNPGTVGLHIVDAFCAGLVLVTTADANHAPEIAYLRNEQNGLMVDNNTAQYADSVVNLTQNPAKRARMQAEALSDSHRYTLDNMVSNFVKGMCNALAS